MYIITTKGNFIVRRNGNSEVTLKKKIVLRLLVRVLDRKIAVHLLVATRYMCFIVLLTMLIFIP